MKAPFLLPRGGGESEKWKVKSEELSSERHFSLLTFHFSLLTAHYSFKYCLSFLLILSRRDAEVTLEHAREMLGIVEPPAFLLFLRWCDQR